MVMAQILLLFQSVFFLEKRKRILFFLFYLQLPTVFINYLFLFLLLLRWRLDDDGLTWVMQEVREKQRMRTFLNRNSHSSFWNSAVAIFSRFSKFPHSSVHLTQKKPGVFWVFLSFVESDFLIYLRLEFMVQFRNSAVAVAVVYLGFATVFFRQKKNQFSVFPILFLGLALIWGWQDSNFFLPQKNNRSFLFSYVSAKAWSRDKIRVFCIS